MIKSENSGSANGTSKVLLQEGQHKISCRLWRQNQPHQSLLMGSQRLACLSVPGARSREWFIILMRCWNKERVSYESLPREDLIRFLQWLKTPPARRQNSKYGEKWQCVLRQGYFGVFCFKFTVYIFPLLDIIVHIIQSYCSSLKVCYERQFNIKTLVKSSEVFHPKESTVFS